MKNLLLKILFVIGIVAVLVLFAVGIVRIVPKIVASLGSGGSNGAANTSSSLAQSNDLTSSDEFLVITETEGISSGKTFNMTWQSPTDLQDREGMFAFTYSCVNDVQLEIIGTNGAQRTLICNRPFTLGTDPVEITLKPTLKKEVAARDIALAVLFYEPEVTLPIQTAKKTVTVTNAPTEGELAASVLTTDLTDLNTEVEEEPSTVLEPETGTPTTPETPLPPVTTPRAPADLEISTPVVSGNRVTFSVTNIGEVPSGVFTLNYTLPGDPIETSPLQRSLNPGEELGFTITITQSIPGGVLSIRVNEDNRVSETNKVNNVVAVNLGFIPGLPETPLPSVEQADLAISNLRTSASTLQSNGTLTVMFDVTNTGSATSAFTLEIAAPTLNTELATSPDGLCALRANKLICASSAMNPRERKSYSFNINNLQLGAIQPVTVSIDTQNVVAEVNELNNQASTLVTIY